MMIKLMSCVKEDITMVGTDNFEEIENGRMTTIENYWSNQNTILGTVQVNPGYYYIGVSIKTNNTLYKIYPLYASSLEI